ncbi:MAG: mechanosensitive ion channel [Halobacteriovoraceae bacterium]|nr:mechanosensitive ion channel [Halobacteriovoraceae bacterium]
MEKYTAIMTQWIHEPFVAKIAFVIILLLLTFVFKNIIFKTIGSKVVDQNNRYKARKALNFLFFLLAILIISLVFNDQLKGLTVAFGVAGAGIAFALQEVIASIAGWFAITFAGFFSIGDRIQLGGIKGDVIDIGALRTTLMECGAWVEGDLYNGRVVRVANSAVFKNPVFNYSADFPFLWDEIKIPIRYGSDIGKAKEIIELAAQTILESYEKHAAKEWKNLIKKFVVEDAQIKNFVSLTADANWITFTLRYVTDYKGRRSTKTKLFTQILKDIDSSNAVQIAGATLEITNIKGLNP